MTSWMFAFRSVVQTLMGCAALMLAVLPSQAGSQREFSDGFDAKTFVDLLQRDRSRWTHFQSTFPQNKADVVFDQHQSGSSAVRFFAIASTSVVSKADIEKEGFDMRAGQEVQVSAWFFIPPDVDLTNLFLIDLECKTCWPVNSVFPDKSPGIRLKLRDRDGTPVVERRKIGLPDMRNALRTDGALPRGRWFKLAWNLTLQADDTGTAEIQIDDQPVFRSAGATFPNPNAFKKWGIELRDTLYDRFQVGITANSSSNPIELFVDTVSFKAGSCSPEENSSCPRPE